MYGGVKFAKLLESTANMRDDNKTALMYERLLNFLVELAVQLKKRLPLDDKVLVDVHSILDPTNLVGTDMLSIFEIASKFPNIILESELQDLNSEWR